MALAQSQRKKGAKLGLREQGGATEPADDRLLAQRTGVTKTLASGLRVRDHQQHVTDGYGPRHRRRRVRRRRRTVPSHAGRCGRRVPSGPGERARRRRRQRVGS